MDVRKRTKKASEEKKLLKRLKKSVFVKKCVKDIGTLLLAGVTFSSGVGLVICADRSKEIEDKYRDLEVRQQQVYADARSDKGFMDWYRTKVNVTNLALQEGVISQSERNENINELLTDDYLRNNIQNIGLSDAEIKEDQEEIDKEMFDVNKENKEVVTDCGVSGILGAVAGSVLGTSLYYQYVTKQYDKDDKRRKAASSDKDTTDMEIAN